MSHSVNLKPRPRRGAFLCRAARHTTGRLTRSGTPTPAPPSAIGKTPRAIANRTTIQPSEVTREAEIARARQEPRSRRIAQAAGRRWPVSTTGGWICICEWPVSHGSSNIFRCDPTLRSPLALFAWSSEAQGEGRRPSPPRPSDSISKPPPLEPEDRREYDAPELPKCCEVCRPTLCERPPCRPDCSIECERR